MTRGLCPFEYLEPTSLPEAIQILSAHGTKAKVLAGGVDLIYRIRRQQLEPDYVVALRNVPDLDHITGDGAEGLKIGALATLRSVEINQAVREDYPLLLDAVRQIDSIQLKNMATVVGNLCVATPASDITPALLALGAALKIVGQKSERTVNVEDFCIGPGKNALKPGEIVTEIIVPTASRGMTGAFLNLVRSATDIAKVSIAVSLILKDGVCQDARIALGSVAPTVFRENGAEALLRGQAISPALIEQAARTAAEAARTISDVRSNADYRREMVAVLTRRAITKAIERAS